MQNVENRQPLVRSGSTTVILEKIDGDRGTTIGRAGHRFSRLILPTLNLSFSIFYPKLDFLAEPPSEPPFRPFLQRLATLNHQLYPGHWEQPYRHFSRCSTLQA
ncbi:hypothetical protein GE061_018011 [Apolygus lucorum]|uniref:Uncharacterized protein n=1 Tax=Apolygus lucorum TaxID=248454 RepID=A0A6A4JA77_APOLU|nr:hypothetical protein GE061_018011 [Apolygus lucorum]